MKVTVDEMLELVTPISGMMSDDELVWLYEQAGYLSPGSAWIEIGAWKGRSFAATALGISQGSRMLAVDTWLGTDGEMTFAFAEAIRSDTAFEAFKSVCQGIKFLRPDLKIGVIRTFSLTAAKHMQPGFADVIFLDSQHTYDAVQEDLHAWDEVLKPGGKWYGHDFNLPGVHQAVTEFFVAPFESSAGNIWVGGNKNV